MMVPRSRPWPALLISALVHLGVALILLGRPGGPAGGSARGVQPGPVLLVHLVAAAPAPAPARPEQPDIVEVQRPAPAVVASEAEPEKAEVETAAAVDAKPAEQPYIDAAAMTRQPEVVSGLVSDTLLIVPGLKAQGVALQVWINEDGGVDRVELDSQMSEEDQQLLLAEFVKVRFSPGRVGRLPVRSHISMQILVDNAIRA
jgi:hypothetical protein